MGRRTSSHMITKLVKHLERRWDLKALNRDNDLMIQTLSYLGLFHPIPTSRGRWV